MKLRLSDAQREVLKSLLSGYPLCEFMTFDPRQGTYRTLGEYVPAKLNYVLSVPCTIGSTTKRIGYRTFWVLFKNNLIRPSRYKGSLSPQSGITGFEITEHGLRIVRTKIARRTVK